MKKGEKKTKEYTTLCAPYDCEVRNMQGNSIGNVVSLKLEIQPNDGMIHIVLESCDDDLPDEIVVSGNFENNIMYLELIKPYKE